MHSPDSRVHLSPGYSAADVDVLADMVGNKVARLLLREAGSLWALRRWCVGRLSLYGVSPLAAQRLVAAFELGARALVAPPNLLSLSGPQDSFAFVAPYFAGCLRERFLAVALDARSRPLHVAVAAEGTSDACYVDPREVFRAAVIESASSVLVAHNHPSGDCAISDEDLSLTVRLMHAGEALGIRLLDHLIVAHPRREGTLDDYVSLTAAGLWPVGRADAWGLIASRARTPDFAEEKKCPRQSNSPS